jgi:hypothetical protein
MQALRVIALTRRDHSDLRLDILDKSATGRTSAGDRSTLLYMVAAPALGAGVPTLGSHLLLSREEFFPVQARGGLTN